MINSRDQYAFLDEYRAKNEALSLEFAEKARRRLVQDKLHAAVVIAVVLGLLALRVVL